MRTIQWSLATLVLVTSGSLFTGCKSSHHGDGPGDGGQGTPGFEVNPTANLQTTEKGGQAKFKVALTSQPSADVVITLKSSDAGEGTVAPATLTFTAANWSSGQEVTVTGQDDDIEDGNVTYQVTFDPATSTDSKYAGKHPDAVSIVNIDDETAGFIVTGDPNQHVSESGTTATFAVTLTTKPTGNVTVGLSSSDEGEVTVSPTTLTFTPDDWNGQHVVTLKGVDDTELDGPQTVTITAAPAASSDAEYNGKTFPAYTVINDDNDAVAFVVKPTSGLVTTELGGQASFTVRLNAAPSADVTVAVSSSDTGEATVYPSKLTFTSANWSSPHVVVVTGVDDAEADGNAPFTIVLAASVSSDARFNNIDPPDVTGTNTDNDSPGITVFANANIEILENGGQGNFTVVLDRAPTASVTIPVSSSNTAKATVAPANLVFTTSNWSAPQKVTITGVDNTLKDGRQPVNIVLGAAVSTDAGYNGKDASDVTVFIIDDDSPGMTVVKADDFTTSETGKQTSLTVRLNAKPTANVTVPVVSSDTGEIIVSPAQLVFTPDNYASPHTVTLTGVNDDLLDGPQDVDITLGPSTSSDPEYLNLTAITVTASNIDDDTAGVTVSPNAGLQTSESGGTDTFTVVLNHAPTANVSFTLAVTKPTEASVAPTSLVFTPANWAAPQTVTLTGLNDATPDADGDQPYAVTFTPAVSDDTDYAGLQVPDVLASNADNDTPGFSVAAVTNNFTTSETGQQATFNVVLNTQPTSNVVIAVVSSRPGEGTVDVSELTFTPTDWAGTHLVIVTGVDDNIADGPQTYPIVLGPAVSDDTSYNGLQIANVNITNTDNDTAGVTVDTGATPIVPLVTDEGGRTATFTVTLHSEPTGVVTIPLSVSKPGEASITPAALVFTPGAGGDWSSTKTVTLKGLGDLAQDGDQPYTVNFGAIQSTDANYAAITIPNLDATNIDSDSAHVTVIGNNLVTTEGGGQASFSLYLGAPPSANVTIPITVSNADEAQIVSGLTLQTTVNVTFTPTDYQSQRVITLQGVDDAVADGPQPYRINMGPVVSADPNYAGRIVPSVNAINNDNDTANITVVAAEPLVTDEFGAAGQRPTFTVVLTSQPTGIVTIPVRVSDTTEATVAPTLLTFTPTPGPDVWNTPHTVEVTGLDDQVADGSQPYFVILDPASSSDTNYNGRTVPNIAAFNTDNDQPGLTIVASPPLQTSEIGGTDTFTIKLTSQPIADVTVTIGSTKPTEGVPVNGMLTFTAAASGGTNSWQDPQTVTIRGVNDDVDDRRQNYEITIASTSTDPNYVITAPNIAAQNADDDTAAFAVSRTTASVNEPNQTATFTVKLLSQPTGNVVVPLSLDLAGEVALSTNSLTFTPDPSGIANSWADVQTVTLTAINDDIADGPQTRHVRFGPIDSLDTDYTDPLILPPDIVVTIVDDDSAAVIVSKTSVSTFEVGTTDSFTVVLTSQPSATATILITSDDTTEATVSPASISFTATDWNVPQTITVTGVQDTPPVLDGDVAYNILLTAPSGATEYASQSRTVTGTNYESFLNCRELKTIHPAAPSGVYWLDTDRTGPVPQDRAWCDQVTDNGGWTLLSWTANSDTLRGLPYPGLAYCTSSTFNCNRGSGVRSAAAANGLFANATELAQGQGITTGQQKTTFDALNSYEFAGKFVYPSLALLTAGTGSATCAGFASGTYTTIADSSQPTRNNGTTVYVAQNLRVSDTLGDYSADGTSYAWSIGNSTGACTTNGTPPASVVGTWQAAQYGPAFQNAAGSYSVWVR